MYYININKQTIAQNRNAEEPKPPIRFQKGKYGKQTYCYELQINGPSKLIYNPHEPILPCGARLVIEAEKKPTVIK